MFLKEESSLDGKSGGHTGYILPDAPGHQHSPPLPSVSLLRKFLFLYSWLLSGSLQIFAIYHHDSHPLLKLSICLWCSLWWPFPLLFVVLAITFEPGTSTNCLPQLSTQRFKEADHLLQAHHQKEMGAALSSPNQTSVIPSGTWVKHSFCLFSI